MKKRLILIGALLIAVILALFALYTFTAQNGLSSNVSIYCWSPFVLSEGSYPAIHEYFQELGITRVYQELSEEYLERPETAEAIQRLSDDHIEVVALLGKRSWGLKESQLDDVKGYVDALSKYNAGIGVNHPIRKIALDVETYTYTSWKQNPKTYFAHYIAKMREIYDYAHDAGLAVVQVIPVHYDDIDKVLFREFVKTCCDELSLMNYTISTQISGIENEVALCRKWNMPLETAFETMPYSEKYSVTDEKTYYYKGFRALQSRRAEILKTYNYRGLSTAYHHFPTMYHVTTGNYLAEIYAYTNSADPTKNELGQTDAVETLILTGDDGNTITAGLYNPNLDAEYAESCYLAVGIRPDVTYTITSGNEKYTVENGTEIFVLSGEEPIDYASVRLKRVKQ